MPQNYNKWTQREDQCLIEIIQCYGPLRWTYIAKKLEKQFQKAKRTGKQCRERWFNNLKTDIDNSEWTLEEDLDLLNTYGLLGNKWTQLAKHFPGRTDNQVKNRFFSTIKKSLRSMCKGVGIKTTSIEIYQIKPNVISEVFYLNRGDRSCVSQSKDVVQFQHSKWSLNNEECLEITQIIKHNISQCANKKKTVQPTDRLRHKWAIFKLIEFNCSYLAHIDATKQLKSERSSLKSYLRSFNQMASQKSDPKGEIKEQNFTYKQMGIYEFQQNLKEQDFQKMQSLDSINRESQAKGNNFSFLHQQKSCFYDYISDQVMQYISGYDEEQIKNSSIVFVGQLTVNLQNFQPLMKQNRSYSKLQTAFDQNEFYIGNQ